MSRYRVVLLPAKENRQHAVLDTKVGIGWVRASFSTDAEAFAAASEWNRQDGRGDCEPLRAS